MVADGEAVHLGPYINDLAGELVAEDRARGHLQKPVTIGEMQIRSADPATPHPDHHVSWVGDWNRALLDG
ncbi:hypothetical protein MCOL_V204825 [Mycobacterium colombiense CECT 3035]|uniref:Uncharacterized protein n=1 Tax=Mycobacterium colombiense CECT 3035 TaxID=1041522 RepID=J5EJ58_9MYCO|nr:hypothetical protein MCOL_V204825 [Mycobacterium colombiense CECT 3035]